jgi:hypothetical protein
LTVCAAFQFGSLSGGLPELSRCVAGVRFVYKGLSFLLNMYIDEFFGVFRKEFVKRAVIYNI